MRRKNYKDNLTELLMDNKRGQVAVFVIIAIVIVAILLIVLFRPRLPFIGPSAELSPISYLKYCVEPDLRKNIESLSNTGGYSNPEGALEYYGDKIKYLCYTSEYYKTCVVQQPLIKEHFEKELSDSMKEKTQECIQSLKKEYEKRGYSVTLGRTDSAISFSPGKVIASFNSPITVRKDTTSKSFTGFNIDIESQMYDLLMIAVSIIDYEAAYGDSRTEDYIQYYPDLKIEKIKLSEGSKVYKVSNVVSEESFRFASRSLSWPPGYGIE